MGRFELRKTSGIAAAMLSAPSTFCYSLSSAHVNNNLPIIGTSLGVLPGTASWIINLELLVVVIACTIAGKLAERFGTATVMAIGSFLFSIFNFMFLIPLAETSFSLVLALRFGASIGLGLFLPCSTPMAS